MPFEDFFANSPWGMLNGGRSPATSVTTKTPVVNPAQKRVDDARTEMYGMARNRVNALQNDPVDAMIRQKLQARTGDEVPYNQTTTDAMMSGASARAAQAQRSQTSGIHGNPTDPAVQAAYAEANARRQASVQSARLGIDQQANTANYNARGQALNDLSGFQQGRNAMTMAAEGNLQGLLSRETAEVPGGPSVSGVILPGGGGSRTGNGGGTDPFADPFFASSPSDSWNTSGMVTGWAGSPQRQLIAQRAQDEYAKRLAPKAQSASPSMGVNEGEGFAGGGDPRQKIDLRSMYGGYGR